MFAQSIVDLSARPVKVKKFPNLSDRVGDFLCLVPRIFWGRLVPRIFWGRGAVAKIGNKRGCWVGRVLIREDAVPKYDGGVYKLQ